MDSPAESSNFKTFAPQIAAALVTSCFSFCFGATTAQTAVIIAQLKKVHNFTGDDLISITDNNAFWISSIGVPSMLVTTVILSYIVDKFGRLNTLRLMTLPFILGETLMATSTNLEMLLIGKAISMGISVSFPIACSVYVTEVSSPKLRGTLLNMISVFVSLGLLLTYVKGKYLTWRTIAFVLNVYVIAFLVLTMFIPESAYWLSLKHRTDQAKKSAQWFGEPRPVVSSPVKPQRDFRVFTKPIFYKPLILVIGFYFFQELSGCTVVYINLITFVNDFGTKTDPYTLSIYVGVGKALISLGNMWFMTKFRRRSLAMFSFVGMAFCISVSATFTALINNDNTSIHWVPPLMLLLYTIFLDCGVMFLPYVLSSELWPGNIRGTATSISIGISNLTIFLALEVYYLMKKEWNSWNIQYFYGIMAMAGALYVYVFIPETHNKSLIEVEQYFWSHSNYISAQAAKNKCDKNSLLSAS